jgi:hypothetical protein
MVVEHFVYKIFEHYILSPITVLLKISTFGPFSFLKKPFHKTAEAIKTKQNDSRFSKKKLQSENKSTS